MPNEQLEMEYLPEKYHIYFQLWPGVLETGQLIHDPVNKYTLLIIAVYCYALRILYLLKKKTTSFGLFMDCICCPRVWHFHLMLHFKCKLETAVP